LFSLVNLLGSKNNFLVKRSGENNHTMPFYVAGPPHWGKRTRKGGI